MNYEDRLSQRVRTVPPSGIRRFFDIAATMDDVISLGIGEPDFVTPSVILEAGIASLRAGETAYTSNSGILELRQEIAALLHRLYGVRYDAEEIIATVGASEAVLLAMMALIEPGDEVIIPEPCFVAYGPAVVFAGGTPVYVSTRVEDNFEVTGAAIDAAVTERTKAIFIGYPNNPTGAVMSRERLLEVADVAARHDLFVLSDEIYDRLVYGVEHTCFAALPDMWERTVLLGGFSKAYAMTGWRLGYVCAPQPLLSAMRKVHQYIIMSAPTTAQVAAITAVRDAQADVEHMRQRYDARRRLIVDGLNQIGLPTFEPKGAFYCFPDVRPTGLSSDDFAERLLQEHHVAAVPGNAFGPSGEGFLRCSYATSRDNIEEALSRIEAFVRGL
ncbi:MAG: aminotransferase class I/II-fold pyridoxal phosphate-dependent enzyme [Anaerolineales bacterium]|nr:aminotransferase class I/II-fold pyridoxal phosphate-dependent enzyme [Anaerolineales bacterium]MCB9128998.1 aminotransferase class I/II-fold pyridoxal phosphate-dependent enzyme [Ardenticatenales bacterium]